MHVLLLNQYFWPDLSAAAQILADLAEDLVAAGAEVTVVTGRDAYTGDGRFPSRDVWQGVDIHRVSATSLGRGHLLARAVDHASFLAAATARAAITRAVDVVICGPSPPFLSLAAVIDQRLSGAKFLYWAQDLFPDAAVELGVLSREGAATRLLEQLSRAALRRADAIVAIGECMAERIASKGIDRERIEVIHNWADGDAITPVDHQDNWFRRQHGLDGTFVVLYSGNLGRGHTFDALLGAARLLAEGGCARGDLPVASDAVSRDRDPGAARLLAEGGCARGDLPVASDAVSRDRDPRAANALPDIQFVFIGDGAKRAVVERAATELPNVRCLPYQARAHLAHSLSAADLAVVTLADQALGVMVPSKLYGHMASARPILYIGPAASTTARTIAAAGCGAHFPAAATEDNIAAIASYIRALAAAPPRAHTLGAAARRAFDTHYTRTAATSRLIARCRTLTDSRAPSHSTPRA